MFALVPIEDNEAVSLDDGIIFGNNIQHNFYNPMHGIVT